MRAKKTPRGGGQAPKQYLHKKSKRPNNPHVGIAAAKSESNIKKTTYMFDPYLDPQLQWSGKSERTELNIDTVMLHIHERIDTSTLIEKVLRSSKQESLVPFFNLEENRLPLYKAIDFYKHQHNWSNRLIVGDSLLVMNSLLEKEGTREKVQMIYIDPPYGIKYASNFQPFVCKHDVKDKDEDLTKEPEAITAFRDTWELEIHSYLSYLRDRVLLAKQMLTETGSCFIQISIDNIHLVRNIMDEIFGAENFVSIITYRTKGGLGSKFISRIADYIVWYANDIKNMKFNPIFIDREVGTGTAYKNVELPNGKRRRMTPQEEKNPSTVPNGSKIYQADNLLSAGRTESCVYEIEVEGSKFMPGGNRSWRTNKAGMTRLIKEKRIVAHGKVPRYVNYYEDYPVQEISNVWTDTGGAADKRYVVQTSDKVIQRCMLMTTDPGDLVFDPTCGSGTTAYTAEKFGRRWITCDTSRVAVTIARQRLMTSIFDYYKLADNGMAKNDLQHGFQYEEVPHVTLGHIAQKKPFRRETIIDKPKIDKTKHRISGPFTIEAVPAPTKKSVDVLYNPQENAINKISPVHDDHKNNSQNFWRNELLKTGIRGKNKQKIRFRTIETHPTTRWIHAVGETEENKPYRVAVSFGPEYAPLDQRQVEQAISEAHNIIPKINMVVFAAMYFDPEASKNIDKINWEGVTVLKVEMNKDLMTHDLKKNRTSNESFWLIGQPDVALQKKNNKYIVKIKGFDYFDMKKDTIVSHNTDKIVLWMLDTDYDGRSIYPQQIFFPMKGSTGSDGMIRLVKTLQAAIDSELITKTYGTESIPFEVGHNKRIAVKIIDDQAVESMKVLDLEERDE